MADDNTVYIKVGEATPANVVIQNQPYFSRLSDWMTPIEQPLLPIYEMIPYQDR